MEFCGFPRSIKRSQRVIRIKTMIMHIRMTDENTTDFRFLIDLYEMINNMIKPEIRLNHAPMDLVSMSATEISAGGISFRPSFWPWPEAVCRERKKAIIRYPPRILGEGNVPMARFAINTSLAYEDIARKSLLIFFR